jgi:hypothetical protein
MWIDTYGCRCKELLIASIPEAAPGSVPRIPVLALRSIRRANTRPPAELTKTVPPMASPTGSHCSTTRGRTGGRNVVARTPPRTV